MKRRSGIFFLILGLAAVLAIFVIGNLEDLERSAAEWFLNQNAKEFFANSIHIQKIALDSHWRVRLEGVTGHFQARQGPVPLELRSLESQDSLLLLLTTKPVRFVFNGLRPQGSAREGFFGDFSYQGGKAWRFTFSGDFSRLDLEDLIWLAPQDLEGATGALKGKIRFSQEADQNPVFTLSLDAPQPGGKLQAKFFDLFLPYLPPSVQKERVVRLVSGKQPLVRYQTASAEVQLPQSDLMKIILKIMVLDYNLKLTLNVTVRTDEKNSFMQIARLMGLIEVKLS